MPKRDAALLLLGHGSTLNADSSAPTYQHAEEIRSHDEFAEVHIAFWKEEPNFRQALRQTSLHRVYVVPNFISSGYFTEQVIPRELGLTGPSSLIGAQEVFYCRPVGLSDSMTAVLLKRAREVVSASPETCEPGKACLFICGHGTSFNDNSTKIIHEQAAIIRAQGNFGDCQAVLMEQAPFVKDWRTLTKCRDVIVVPFFISDGLHSYEDIPVLLGLTHNIREQGFTNPHREDDRRLWYATAIGTEPSIADAILDSVAQFDAEHGVLAAPAASPRADTLDDDLARFLRAGPAPCSMGQVIIRPVGGDIFELLHGDDRTADPASLQRLRSLEDLRQLIRLGPDGTFRPLRAAPNLRRGWIMRVFDREGLRAALDYLYPAEVANWSLWKKGELVSTPWQETAARQTGRFRIVRDIGDDGIRELTAQVCDRGCLKRRLWSPSQQPVASATQEISLLCPEACNYLVGKAREKLKGADGDPE
jgi:sirohydrochlorin cobaltochelatase